MTGKGTIRWLGEEALRRFQRLGPSTHVPIRNEIVSEVRKTRGGAILDPQDIIRDVLDDNDFVSSKYSSIIKSRNMYYISDHMTPAPVAALANSFVATTEIIPQSLWRSSF